MGGDAETLDFYTREATAYADHTAGEADHPAVDRFLDMLAPGGRVLDFGCGPGWAAGRFKERGFRVEGFDGSEGLAAEARTRYGIEVTVGRFEEFRADQSFDGIWASFCLLHDSREAMPGHLTRLVAALNPGGAFYIGLKEGEGQERDDLGRLYTYFTEAEMRELLTAAGFTGIEAETEPSVGFSGQPCTSMHLFCRRA